MSAKIVFPQSFQFGIGDADLQVVGEDFTRTEEKAEQTMWDEFAKKSGRVFENTPPGIAIDRYHLWEQDIEILKELGIKHYRTSVSMARILKRDGSVNSKAIAWYRAYFKGLRQADIQIYVTLYHWELPQYLSEQGGWKNKKTLDTIVQHAEIVMTQLGEYIDEYFLFNEPRHISFRSYFEGIQAPGEKDLSGGILAAHHVLLAHGLVTKRLLEIDNHAKISTVLNMTPCYAASDDKKDLKAVKIADSHRNGWFGDPLYFGTYPQDVVELFGKAMPKFDPSDMQIIQVGPQLHAMGINYYKGSTIEFDAHNILQYKLINPSVGEKNSLGWPIFKPPHLPEGLYDIMTQMYHRYKKVGLKELYLAENGTALESVWDGKQKIIADDTRISYLKEHLRQTYAVINKGIPLTKYFLWTLMDNYEWSHGYKPDAAFGIIHVDRQTMKRIPKTSAKWYKNIIKTHTLTL